MGGVDLNWTRDLTTSARGAQVKIKESKGTNLRGNMQANMRSKMKDEMYLYGE